jgi:hypothetical protein
MKDGTEEVKKIRILGTKILPHYKKAKLYLETIDKSSVNFNNTKFVVNYDIDRLRNLSLGDVCVIDPEAAKTFRETESSSLAMELLGGVKYVIIAFIEMGSRNARGTFCALGIAESSKIVDDGNTLLLFWPEELKKV